MFISLPKSWVKQFGIDKGASVPISRSEDGKLIIDPKYGTEPLLQTVTLAPGPYLSREIIGKYLLGFDIIRVETRNRVSLEMRDVVKKTVATLIGLEIIEEDYSGIVLQCLLEPSGFPPEKILRRAYMIAAGMHRDVVNALVDRDIRLATSVVDRDDEVNRLYFLLVRILRTIIQNPGLGEKLGVRQIECLDYRLVSSFVEGIGDECVRVAQKIAEFGKGRLSEDLKKALVAFDAVCFEGHEKALKAFLAGDTDTAEAVRALRERNEKAFVEIEEAARAQTLDVMSHVLSVASSLRQIFEHSVDISDLVIPRKQ